MVMSPRGDFLKDVALISSDIQLQLELARTSPQANDTIVPQSIQPPYKPPTVQPSTAALRVFGPEQIVGYFSWTLVFSVKIQAYYVA